MYDLVIIGGGPGGVAAGVYAARKKMKTALITESFGGQSLVSADVQNWIGTPSVSGFDLGQMLEGHLRAQQDIEIVVNDLVTAIEELPGAAAGAGAARAGARGEDGARGADLKVRTKKGREFDTKYVLLASGSRRRRLGVPGEDKLDGKGVAYCSICDAPLFGGKAVAVVGGGNAGLEAVIDLLPYAAKIYLLEKSDALRGDKITQDKIRANEKVEIIARADTKEILGDAAVTGVRYADLARGAGGGAGEVKQLDVEGVFVEIGAIPNSDFVKGLVELNALGEVVANPRTQATSHPRIWAVGDVSDVRYKQNNISAGDAVKAALNIYETLQISLMRRGY